MSLASQYTQGMGGLKFIATSPPGQGRLIRIPFYLQDDPGDDNFQVLEPDSGMVNNSTTSPVIVAGRSGAGISDTSVILKTPQISWATLRLVGFEADINYPSNPGAAVSTTNNQTAQPLVNKDIAQVLFKDLQIGGGASLFVHEEFANGSIYSVENESFAGLRDYPLVKSPNQAQVQVQLFQGISGQKPIAGGVYTELGCLVLFSCALVCEILQDDQYGSHIPGPYAR